MSEQEFRDQEPLDRSWGVRLRIIKELRELVDRRLMGKTEFRHICRSQLGLDLNESDEIPIPHFSLPYIGEPEDPFTEEEL